MAVLLDDVIGIVKEEKLFYISKIPFLINLLFAKTCQDRLWKLCAWKSNLFELSHFILFLGVVLLIHAEIFFIS